MYAQPFLPRDQVVGMMCWIHGSSMDSAITMLVASTMQ